MERLLNTFGASIDIQWQTVLSRSDYLCEKGVLEFRYR